MDVLLIFQRFFWFGEGSDDEGNLSCRWNLYIGEYNLTTCQNQMLRYILKLVFLTVWISTLAQQPGSVKNEALQLKKLILQHHFDPKPVDDLFSAKVFDHVLNALDPEKLYFTQQDITVLSTFKNKIDDDLTGTSWNFLPAITERYKQSLLRCEAIITRHTKVPFDLSKKRWKIHSPYISW